MSFMDNLKKLTQPYDDDDAADFPEDELDVDDGIPYAQPAAAPVQPVQPVQPAAAPVQEPVMQSAPAASAAPTGNPFGGAPFGSAFSGVGSFAPEAPAAAPASAAPIKMGGVEEKAPSKYRVVVVRPEEFDAATPIAKRILEGDTVILNCEDTNENIARRIIDFLSGCAFAVNGSILRAAEQVIIIAPNEVGVDEEDGGEAELEA